MTFQYQIQPASENALLLTFSTGTGNTAGLMDFLPLLKKLIPQIETVFAQNLRELVPSYHSLLLVFDLQQLSYATAKQQLQNLVEQLQQDPPNLADFHQDSSGKIHVIPVCYDLQFGLDLAELAQQKALSIEDIIRIHSERTYQVCAIGFAPAFAYLGEVDERIASPRHASPRLSIPAGSVGIADRQTAIYPKASPAGWQILGQTPWDLSLNNPDNLMRFRVGDQVNFEPIGYNEFLAIKNGEAS